MSSGHSPKKYYQKKDYLFFGAAESSKEWAEALNKEGPEIERDKITDTFDGAQNLSFRAGKKAPLSINLEYAPDLLRQAHRPEPFGKLRIPWEVLSIVEAQSRGISPGNVEWIDFFSRVLSIRHEDGFAVKWRDYKLKLSGRTLIMGVLNVTPDSFSDGGRYFDPHIAVERAMEMERLGADIIDIGAESTRPGAKPVSPEEQLKRIEETVRILGKKLKIPISIDTSSSVVARKCLDLGASIINDITALRKDKKLGVLIAKFKAGVILMHMKGTPRSMQKEPVYYKDVILEILNFLKRAKEKALAFGISSKSIIVDPGIGFGKTVEHNLRILKGISCFKLLECPVLIGTSRKSFIGKVLDLPLSERETGTAASVAYAIAKGADIVRVHDVKLMRQASILADRINGEKL